MSNIRAVKFCHRNIKRTDSSETLDVLKQEYKDVVSAYVTDCFRRCLRCRVNPFCRIQLETIEGENAHDLLNKVLNHLEISYPK